MKSISIPLSLIPELGDIEVGDTTCVKLEGEITDKTSNSVTMALEEASLQETGEHEYEDEEQHRKRTLVIGIVEKPRRARSEAY